MYKRKIYQKMLEWKTSSNGQTALLIEGARRIGKSTVAEEFAKKEYTSYILIDFAFAPSHIQELFQDLTDLNYLFLQLQLHYGVNLIERESLIIFDEVQFNPMARQAIKRLVADRRYDYLETGSLISIRKNVENILIPSEERKIQMYPMDFEEFLWTQGDEATIPLLAEVFEKRIALGETQNRNLMRKFRLYMLVGGMPQAVENYHTHYNFKFVDEVKRDIISLYEEDFYKIDQSGKVSLLYDMIPSELGKHSAGYQVSSIFPNERKESLMNEFAELLASKTVLPSYNVSDPNIGLAYSRVSDKFRLYLADTGLLVTLMFKDKDFTDNVIYSQLLNDKLSANLGIVYENIVAQILTANGHQFYYHTYYDSAQKRNFEIDFLITSGKKITPIEVKSSGYKAHKFLNAFGEKYSGRIKEKIVLYTKDLQKEGDTTYLPIYLACFL